jgi:hypothetical protein
MRLEEWIVAGVLACILGILTWTAGNAFAASGASSTQVALLCTTILLAGLAFGSIVRFIPRPIGIAAGLGCVVFGIIVLVLHLHVVPVCGDKVCGIGECSICTQDCTLDDCADGACQPPSERCDRAKDCACDPQLACLPGRNGSDERGCGITRCGDGFCDDGETSVNCCKDCRCEKGFSCLNDLCYFIPPDIGLQVRLLTNDIGVTSLVGNHLLLDGEGRPQPLAAAIITTDGFVHNVTVTFTLRNVSDTFPLGQLAPGAEVPVLWYIQPTPALLTLDSDVREPLTIAVRSFDSQGDERNVVRNLHLTLRGRGTIDKFGHIVLYVTPIPVKGTTPAAIWDELRSQVRLEADRPTTQFPAETLVKGAGTERDIAVLAASMFESAGMRATLVEGPAGLGAGPLRVFVGVQERTGLLLIDPSRIDRPIAGARIQIPGVSYHDIQTTYARYNLTQLTFDGSAWGVETASTTEE